MMTDDDDILAGEYALGLLDPAGAVTVQDRARHDAPLSLRIAWWRDQLSPLVDTLAVDPPATLWRGIERRIAANDNAPVLVSRWRGAALAAMSVAAALVVYIGVTPPPAPEIRTRIVQAPAPMVASLTGANGVQVSLAVDNQGRVRINPVKLDAGQGDPELWVIPADGTPRSLGVFDARARRNARVAEALRVLIAEGVTLAVSLEPKGGSKTGAPTGPVVATGQLTST